MTVIIMPKLQAYTDNVTKISEAAERCLSNHRREHARERVRTSLAFYQAVVTTSNPMMRTVSFEAAIRELDAAAGHLKEELRSAPSIGSLSSHELAAVKTQ